jgi:acetylornithine deacetylase/succinyl-diaminopimelate desuccinylase-like protein
MSDVTFDNYLNRSQRPSLTIIGIDDIPACINGGNVIRPRTTIKVSIRLPPTLSLAKAKEIITEKCLSNPPYGAKISLEWGMLGAGFSAPIYPSHLEDILNECARESFDNNEVLFNHEGGSIPFMNILTQRFPKSMFMVTGLLGPGSNAHAGNENLHVPTLKRLLHGMTRFCEKLAYVDFAFKDDERPRGKSCKV